MKKQKKTNIKTDSNLIRLNKFISETADMSRRKADEVITQGRVQVNGKTIIEFGMKIDPAKDIVLYDGEKLKLKKYIYILLNKPRGVISSTKDEKGRTTVVELINLKTKLFPVGRLDYNTTGVLILTNNGDFTNKLLHPKYKFIREYKAILDKPLDEAAKEKLLKGVMIDNRKSRFLTLTLSKNNLKTVVVTTQEGRNHFVKNMFATVGFTVEVLHRSSFGGITDKNLPIGAYRELTENEVMQILDW